MTDDVHIMSTTPPVLTFATTLDSTEENNKMRKTFYKWHMQNTNCWRYFLTKTTLELLSH